MKLRSSKSKSIPIVIYESTVYPGATEEVCVPILEKKSGLINNTVESCGFSVATAERVNPGDKVRVLTKIVKITSGSCTEAGIWVDQFYSSFIEAGTHLAPTIKVAEAAKLLKILNEI